METLNTINDDIKFIADSSSLTGSILTMEGEIMLVISIISLIVSFILILVRINITAYEHEKLGKLLIGGSFITFILFFILLSVGFIFFRDTSYCPNPNSGATDTTSYYTSTGKWITVSGFILILLDYIAIMILIFFDFTSTLTLRIVTTIITGIIAGVGIGMFSLPYWTNVNKNYCGCNSNASPQSVQKRIHFEEDNKQNQWKYKPTKKTVQ